MAVTVRIPTQLRPLSGGAAEVEVEGSTVGAVLASLEDAHAGFRERLFGADGELRRFVNVFVADEDVRFLNGLDTAVGPGQTVSIIPAVAGGCSSWMSAVGRASAASGVRSTGGTSSPKKLMAPSCWSPPSC